MRKWILNLHMYGGLLCASYLIIFGVSSLQYNHRFWEPGATGDPVRSEHRMTIPALDDNRALADAVVDELDLMGWYVPWQSQRDSAGDFRFVVTHPGKEYTIQTSRAEGMVSVEERFRGYGSIIGGLHALMQLPRSRFMSGWGLYTEICTWVVLLSAISGVYLWTNRPGERVIGLLLVFLFSGGALAFMVYIWARG